MSRDATRCRNCATDLTDPTESGFEYDGYWFCSEMCAEVCAGYWSRGEGDDTPEIVCLCGSTKFKEEYREANKRLSLEGKIVLSVGFFGHADGWPEEAAGPGGVIGPAKNCMDRLHKHKIDLADRIHVINPGGYIGDSTREEIEYARETGTEITAMNPITGVTTDD